MEKNNFVVAWSNVYFINIQIFTDDGIKVGTEIQFGIGSYCFESSITTLANSNFVVAYHCNKNIYADIFYSNGTGLKSQIMVNTLIGYHKRPSISSISTSNFIIVWESQGQDIIGAFDCGIYGQIFTSYGVKIGNEFRVNTYIIDDQSNPSIASLANDNYIVTWQSNNQDGSGFGVYGQILDSTGNKLGSEFKINTFTLNSQSNPSVASLINTNFVVVWDNNSQNIFGNIYQIDGSVVGFDTCPFNCQSCINSTKCILCNPNFKLKSNGLCGCFDGFYLDNILGSTCISKFIIFN